jgi:hypothetical protein
LSPIFAVVVPPAGVVLGYWALVQIRRSGENGRTAAIRGLVIGYLLTAVLLIPVILWATTIRSEQGLAVARPPFSLFGFAFALTP